jgi:hypothetical protein
MTSKVKHIGIQHDNNRLITPSQLCDILKQDLQEDKIFEGCTQMLTLLIKTDKNGQPIVGCARANMGPSDCIVACEIAKNFFLNHNDS